SEVRVVPEESPPPRHEPEPTEAQGGQRQQDCQEVVTEEVSASPVERKPLGAEVRTGDHERLPFGQEEGVVEPEGQPGQERALDEKQDEPPRLSPEREADASPRGAAESIAAGAHRRNQSEEAENTG